jgi:uncharacterized protein (TIGR03792 family)
MNGILRRLATGAILAGLLTTLIVFQPTAAGAQPPPPPPMPQVAPAPGADPAPAAAVAIDPEPSTPAAVRNAATSLVPSDSGAVVEMLRLRVSSEGRQAWLAAERDCWDPWLRQQAGFLGRELLWDREREEAVLLIRWASLALWQAIPQAEIDRVQGQFDATANRALGRSGGSPFPLLSSGSLQPQGRA